MLVNPLVAEVIERVDMYFNMVQCLQLIKLVSNRIQIVTQPEQGK
jgi:hypothetical protein